MKTENKTDTAPAIDQPKAMTVRDKIGSDKFLAEIAKALPSHLTPERFTRVALTALTKTPKLAECDQASLFSALLSLSQLGLEPDGRRAHLIPFDNRKKGIVECQLIIDYKGLVELALRSGLVSFIHADVVCDADEFDFDRGELKRHRINYREERGAVFAAYSLCRFKDGSEKCEVMSRREVEAIRARSRSGSSGPWVTDFCEMAKKTAFRRLSKWLPLSPEFRDALEADSDEMEDRRFDSARAATIPSFNILKPEPIFQEAKVAASTPPQEETSEAKADGVIDIQPVRAAHVQPPSLASQLADFLEANRVAHDDFVGWLKTTGRIKRDAVIPTLDDISSETLNHLLSDQASLAKCVRIYGGAA